MMQHILPASCAGFDETDTVKKFADRLYLFVGKLYLIANVQKGWVRSEWGQHG